MSAELANIRRNSSAVDMNGNKPPENSKIDHENYPEVYNASEVYPEALKDENSLPEVAISNEPQLVEGRGYTKNGWTGQSFWRKRWFWILVGVLAVVILVAVVGGVVGSGATSRQNSRAITILNTTALASMSYKQADGTSQYRVYFQAESGALYQSVWSSETQRWAASPLKRPGSADVTGEPAVKLGTPLSAHVYGSVENEDYEYHVFFLDVNNSIWELVSTDPDDMWNLTSTSSMKANYAAAPFSKLASYGRQCGEECGNATSIVVWQSEDDEIWLAGYKPSEGWLAFAMNVTVEPPPVQGTSISIVSLGPDEGLMSVYVNTGSPTRLHFNITDGWTLDGSVSGKIDPGAAITSLITNYDTADAETAELKVICTRPESSGGIFLWQNGKLDTSWLNSNADPPLSTVSNSSSITSNQAGGVYAMEGSRIAEWRWESNNSSFVRIGIVDTSLGE